jgi:hypothetical protein
MNHQELKNSILRIYIKYMMKVTRIDSHRLKIQDNLILYK